MITSIRGFPSFSGKGFLDEHCSSAFCLLDGAKKLYHGYNIATLSEESNDAGEFDWVIKMDWENWEKAGSPGMSGMHVDLRLPEHICAYIQAIVDQRTLPDTRGLPL